MAGGEGNQMREAFERNRIAVVDEARHGFGETQKFHTGAIYRNGKRPGVHGAPASSSAFSMAFKSTSTSTRSFSCWAANSWLAMA